MFDPSPYPLGFDVSDNNGPIAWGTVDPKYKFVGCKKSQGVSFTDRWWTQNYASIQAKSLRLVAYHYMMPLDDAEQQAQWFLNGLSLNAGDRCALDLEGIQWKQVDAALRPLKVIHFSAAVKDMTGKNPILYFSKGEMSQYMDMSQFQDWDWWIADLSDGPVDCLIRQYNFQGTVDGIGGGVDMDAWVGPF